MNDEAVYRTARATPGLFKLYSESSLYNQLLKLIWECECDDKLSIQNIKLVATTYIMQRWQSKQDTIFGTISIAVVMQQQISLAAAE